MRQLLAGRSQLRDNLLDRLHQQVPVGDIQERPPQENGQERVRVVGELVQGLEEGAGPHVGFHLGQVGFAGLTPGRVGGGQGVQEFRGDARHGGGGGCWVGVGGSWQRTQPSQ